MPRKPPPPLERAPLSRETVLKALEQSRGAVGKNDIARALQLDTAERRELRKILKELEAEGALGRVGRRAFASATALPERGVMEIVDQDTDGELLGRFRGTDGLFGPPVRLAPGEARGGRDAPAVGIGDRVLVRLDREAGGETVARVVKRLGQSAHRILGVFRQSQDARARGAGWVEPADRKVKTTLLIDGGDRNGAEDGALVLAELAPGGGNRPHGPKRGRVVEIVGRMDDPRAASILALHAHGIPDGFSDEEIAEAKAAKKPTLKGRTDLRQIPLITIDPEDARDHDDAVFAEITEEGGARIWVAIADVAAYVRPGSALDRGAVKRGNSTYFPDRVAPMLPEALSADLCSLREGEDRACLAVEITFDKNGRKTKHRFVRGLMKSAAKLAYAQAQAAIDGTTDEKTGPLLEPILKPLWAAYAVMKKGRDARSPLEIASTEHRIRFGPDGRVVGVQRRETLEANKLIEEFMIQANVAAAEELERLTTPLLYRIHDRPSDEKIAALADFLETVNLSWAKGQTVTPARFNRLLALSRETEHADIVNEVVLRSQAQAVYSPDNIGHFGLNLRSYGHFTSPIRRYADVIVHRALIRALKLGDDGLTDSEMQRLEEIADHITMTERRSMAAEREATDRYIAAFLADRVGATFEGRISGVTRFGLFVKLKETAADGLCPAARLGGERWVHDEAAHALVGQASGYRFQLGQEVEVRLVETAPVSGGLVFDMVSDPLEPQDGWRKRTREVAGRRPLTRGPKGPERTEKRKRRP